MDSEVVIRTGSSWIIPCGTCIAIHNKSRAKPYRVPPGNEKNPWKCPG